MNGAASRARVRAPCERGLERLRGQPYARPRRVRRPRRRTRCSRTAGSGMRRRNLRALRVRCVRLSAPEAVRTSRAVWPRRGDTAGSAEDVQEPRARASRLRGIWRGRNTGLRHLPSNPLARARVSGRRPLRLVSPRRGRASREHRRRGQFNDSIFTIHPQHLPGWTAAMTVVFVAWRGLTNDS